MTLHFLGPSFTKDTHFARIQLKLFKLQETMV